MYDYREDIKQLLNVTGNTHNELKIAAEAIRVILKIAEKNGNEQQQTVSESEEEQKDDQSEQTAQLKTNKVDVKTVPEQKSDLVQETTVAKEEPELQIEVTKRPTLKIDRTLQTLQTMLTAKGDSKALEAWIKKEPQIFEKLFEMVMVYKVSTRRMGFKAYNKNNKELKFNEFIRNQYNPRNGDAIIVNNAHSDTPRIVKLIRRPDELYVPNTITFDQGVVEMNDEGKLVVEHDVNGHELVVDGRIFTYKVPLQAFNVKEGSLVRLRWYARPRGIRLNDDISIAWVYPEKHEHPNVTSKKESTPKAAFKPAIEFDLAGKTVGIVVGRELYRDKYEEIIKAHGGEMIMVDAFYHRRDPERYFARRLSGADYVVMVQNQNKHNTSYALAKIKDQFKGFAVAKNLTGIQVEQAIYRAYKGLPAFVTGQ